MSEGKYCSGDHRIHVANVAVVEEEGKVCILALCLQCGQGFLNEHKVANSRSSNIQLLDKKENQ